jgi:Raf kinase inhibitor-like YbhB/YbcL family protein
MTMPLTIKSTSFRDGEQVPRKYTGDGDNVSPPLSWSDLPPETRELALIVEDPDAKGPFPFVHWVVYKIGAALDSLPEGNSARALPAGVAQGKNSFERVGYDGPAPPPGRPHHYQFRLYALDHVLDLQAGLDKKAVLAAMEGHGLAEAVLTGVYQRDR